jgi:VPDSG-CTERM motif
VLSRTVEVMLIVIAITVTVGCAISSNASALPLSYSTPGVVGTLDGKIGNSNPSTELIIAQHILELIGLGTTSLAVGTQYYKNSTASDYSAILSNPVQSSPHAREVPLGIDYVLAKYNGKNAGYVLFHLPDFGTHTLPRYPANLWTTDATKWEISHFTQFDSVSVPDGGTTVAMLTAALCGLGLLRRRLPNVGNVYKNSGVSYQFQAATCCDLSGSAPIQEELGRRHRF